MTVSYSEGLHLLFKWHGSVWKAVWKDLIVWLILYYAIRLTLAYAPQSADQHKLAVEVVKQFHGYVDKIPVSFLLGFFVVQIVTRWWSQVFHVAWPDEVMVWTNSCFPKPEQKHIRQTVARWLVLCQAMVFRKISKRIRRRFPTTASLIDAGLLTEQELAIIYNTKTLSTRWQLPLQWIMSKVVVPAAELAPPTKCAFTGAVNKFEDFQRSLFMHDWIGIPLVYVQTCTVVVYGYFLFCAIGNQYIGQGVDLYVPILAVFQFIFYMGWFKVGQDLLRPFGEDDDDLELNCILDRNAAVAMNLADQIAEESPDLIADPKIQQEFVEKMLNNMAYSKGALARNLDRPPKLRSVVEFKGDDNQMIVPGADLSGNAAAAKNLHIRADHLREMLRRGGQIADPEAEAGGAATAAGGCGRGARKIRHPPNLF